MGIIPIILMATPDCPDDKQPPFTRTILITFYGTGAGNATRQDFARSYGGCCDVNASGEKVLQYFESFGINMTIPRQDPFKHHFLEEYQFESYVVEHPTSRALTSSFFEYGEYLNAPVHRSFWDLWLHADVNGPRGLLKRGVYQYGFLR